MRQHIQIQSLESRLIKPKRRAQGDYNVILQKICAKSSHYQETRNYHMFSF